MLKVGIFAVFDTAAGAYNPPFPAPTTAFALRGFSDAANDKQGAIGQHPEDYHLFHIGTFDLKTGELEALHAPTRVGTALEYVKTDGAQ